MRYLALLAVLLLAACAAQAPAITPDAAVQAFEAAGLAAADVSTSDVLPAPIAEGLSSCSGARFNVEGEMGARVVVCREQAQAEALAAYYEGLGEEGTPFYSHVEHRGGLVLQMNGQLPAETFDRYVAALP